MWKTIIDRVLESLLSRLFSNISAVLTTAAVTGLVSALPGTWILDDSLARQAVLAGK